MPIVKINVHKVNAERSLKAKGGQIKINNNVSIKGKPPEQPGLLMHLLNLLPWIVIFAIWIYILRQQTGMGKGGAFSFGQNAGKNLLPLSQKSCGTAHGHS